MATSALDHRPQTVREPLRRSCDDRLVTGVAGGIGQHLGIDPLLVRVAFVLLAFSGTGLLAYLVAWIVLPDGALETDETGVGGAGTARLGGFALVGLGVLLLTQRVTPTASVGDLAPLLLIALGVLLALRAAGPR
jgi:phage shock protein PspC (stress-responsive transcriptional regulator)